MMSKTCKSLILKNAKYQEKKSGLGFNALATLF